MDLATLNQFFGEFDDVLSSHFGAEWENIYIPHILPLRLRNDGNITYGVYITDKNFSDGVPNLIARFIGFSYKISELENIGFQLKKSYSNKCERIILLKKVKM